MNISHPLGLQCKLDGYCSFCAASQKRSCCYVHINKTYPVTKLDLGMLKESHRENDLLQQCRQVVIVFEEL